MTTQQKKKLFLVAYEAYGPYGGHKRRWSNDYICITCPVTLPHQKCPKDRDIWFSDSGLADEFEARVKKVCQIEKVERSEFNTPELRNLLKGSYTDIIYSDAHFPTGTVVEVLDAEGRRVQRIVSGISRASATSTKLLVCWGPGAPDRTYSWFTAEIDMNEVYRIVRRGEGGLQYSARAELTWYVVRGEMSLEHRLVRAALRKLGERQYYDVDAIVNAIGTKIRRYCPLVQKEVLDASYVNQFVKKNRSRFRLGVAAVRVIEREQQVAQEEKFKQVMERMVNRPGPLVTNASVKMIYEVLKENQAALANKAPDDN